MEFTKKVRNLRRKMPAFRHRLAERGRKLCAVAVCASMVLGGFPSAFFQAFAADDYGEYEFEFDRASFYDALDAAVKDGTTLDRELEFKGDHADEYGELFNPDGSLYELKELEPDKDAERDKNVGLRVFVRIEGDISLDEAYTADGSEEVYFLFTNKTDTDNYARVILDDCEIEMFRIPAAKNIPVENTSWRPEIAGSRAEGPGNSGSAGAGGGIVIEGSSSDKAEDSGIYEDSEVSIDEGAEKEADFKDTADEAGREATSGQEDADKEDRSDEKADAPEHDTAHSEADRDKESDKDHPGKADAGDKDASEGRDSSSDKDASEGSDSFSDKDVSGSRDADSNKGSQRHRGASPRGGKSASDGRDSSDKNSADKGRETASSVSARTSHYLTSGLTITGNAGDEGGLEISIADTDDEEAAVSFTEETTVEVAAAEDDDFEAASPSDAYESASPSDASNSINGTLHDPVRLANRGAVAFETTAEDLGLDKFAQEDVVYTAEDGGVSVTVTAPARALPSGAELKVELYGEDSAEYKEAFEFLDLAEDRGMALLDIGFFNGDEEVEPSKAVTVSIDASAIIPDDVDLSTVRVNHLDETAHEMEAVLVADAEEDSDGYFDTESAIAEFSVTSFSRFEIDWGEGDGSSIEVHVYNMSGTGIEEIFETYEHTRDDLLISDIVDRLYGNSEYVSSYHFEYAAVYYETSNQMAGYDAYTLGSEDNSVIEIKKSGTTYTVTFANRSSETVSDPYIIFIYLYYSIPTITISTENSHTSSSINFTTTYNYFKGLEAVDSNVTYTWGLSDESLGTIEGNNEGTATFTWIEETDEEGPKEGDQVTVTVTMTNTYTDESGEKITEQASDTYTLTYGDHAVTITVYQNDDRTVQENAHVALVDENGNTVATGITGSNGTVTLYVPSGNYTVGVTYVYATTQGAGSTTRYTTEGSITVTTDENGNAQTTGDTNLNLGSAITSTTGSTGVTSADQWDGSTPYYYEHIDVKVALAEGEGRNETFSDLDSVYVFDKYGNLIYTSADLIANDDTTDYNCKFNVNGTEDVHSIVVSSEDTIVITYEVIVTYDNGDTETKTYTAVLSADTTYGDEYYSYYDVNAYQLYNAIYGTSYSETEFLRLVNNETLPDYNENGISLEGLSFTQVADYLCDTRQSNQAGLDFCIDFSAIEPTNIDLRVVKEYLGLTDTTTAEDLAGTVFDFEIIELDSLYEDAEGNMWYVAENSVLGYDTGSTNGTWTQNSDGAWVSEIEFSGDIDFTYESESGTNYFYYIIHETGATKDGTEISYNPKVEFYGVRVMVTFHDETGLFDITVSYCELTPSGEVSSSTGIYTSFEVGTWHGLKESYGDIDGDGEDESYYSLTYVNTAELTLKKVGRKAGSEDSDSDTDLDGAEFTLSKTEEREIYNDDGEPTGETVEVTSYYYYNDSDDFGWIEESNLGSEEIPTFTMGEVPLPDMTNATCELTEVKAPDGYNQLLGSITFTVKNGVITEVSMIVNGQELGSTYCEIRDDGLTLTIANYTNTELPQTGGSGTLPFRAAGAFLSGSALWLLFLTLRRRRRWVES